jgi:hypothetical protein
MLRSSARIGQLIVPMRSVQSLALLLSLGSACALEDSPPDGSAGAQNTGGVSSQAGTAGAVAQAGAGGGWRNDSVERHGRTGHRGADEHRRLGGREHGRERGRWRLGRHGRGWR